MRLSRTSAMVWATLVGGGEAYAQSVTWFPGEGTFATMVFEDQWPHRGDYDFNDAVLRVNVIRQEDASNDVAFVTWTFHVYALGATKCSGAALRIPYAPEAITVDRVRGAAGAMDGAPWTTWATTPVSDGAGGSVLEISPDLRALCGVAGFINTTPGSPTVDCDPVGLRVALNPASATLPGEPGDVFLFGCGAASGQQVHRSAYYGVPGGTYDVDESLYLRGDDASEVDPVLKTPTGSRFYVNGLGLPWGLVFGDDLYHIPAERQDITTVFDLLADYVTDPGIPFWHTPNGNAFTFTGSAPPLPVAQFGADGVCDLGDSGEGDCDGVCAPEDALGSPDCDGICAEGYHIEGVACVDDVQPCAVDHGTGTRQWSGSGYGACVADDCDTGYHVASGACVPTCPGGQEIFTYTGGTQVFTTPPGCNQLVVDVYGGGGGGSTHVPDHGSWGGGGGGFARSALTTSEGTTYAVTVGHGGPAAYDGSGGGASSFGSLLSASGGGFPGGGSGSGGNLLNHSGGTGNRWVDYGPGGGGGGAAGPSGNGGSGYQGGPGGGGGGGYAGAGGGSNGAGGSYGGGGGGGSFNSVGGSGAPGLVVVVYSRVP